MTHYQVKHRGMLGWLVALGLTLIAPLPIGAAEPGPISSRLREEWKLDRFYQKQVDAGGLLVVGSAKVSDHALAEAAWIVGRMLDGRKDLLQAMRNHRVRVAVMAANEYTTDLPEHGKLKPKLYWDRRARGLGATLANPVVSCGEENLLDYPGDPYPNENIFVHEFAHAIHGTGLSTTDPTFDRRLRDAYHAAIERGLWKNTYAATNHSEYWAEGVQSWFDDNAPPDALHNNIRTRAKLKEYDRPLAQLCQEVFGDRPWRYLRPAKRQGGDLRHLQGYDPKKLPRFHWRKASLGDLAAPLGAGEPLIARQTLLDHETFWDNKDWDWYKANIPFFECPDGDIQTTYYYRWELLTKHLTYGSPNSGYSFTEFIDRPFWSGTYGAISCPAGHQLYEARWLRAPRFARDYARYWFRTPGAQPRNYSTWLADATWAVHRVHPDDLFVKDLLPDLKKNYEGWEKRHFVADVGLFWQTGHDDGMEFNINSRQTKDILRGAPGYRPTINAYMWADALAIARIAEHAGDKAAAAAYRAKAAGLKENLQKKLWDPKRKFFFPMSQRDEEADGFKVKARTLTYQTGRYAGSPYGRELIGYVPWQFSMPDNDKGYEAAWKKLFAKDGFAAPFGPTTVERNDPLFLLKKSCCWWSGQSWPYATSQTLKAMANLLQEYDQKVVTPAEYVKLLQTFARTHRKNGKPYLAEACNPDTGSFAGHDAYDHSEHYFHSSFNDLIITGLVGLHPRDDDILEVKPLAPANWAYFALDSVPYRGHLLSVLWDRDGTRYKRGTGLRLFVDGKEIAASDRLAPLSAKLPACQGQETLTQPGALPARPALTAVNYAANNDGTYFPRISASYSHPRTPPSKLSDGNSWYHRDPPNRWTCEGSPNTSDTVVIDLGMKRTLHTVKLYFLDDEKGIVPPARFDLEYWTGKDWKVISSQTRTPSKPAGRRANEICFPALATTKIRAVLHHAVGGKTGLTEFEVWGDARLPLAPPPHPSGNLAYNPGDKLFPKASASYSDHFGGKPAYVIDGKTNFLPSPSNRWTSYESPNATDWLEVDFGLEKEFGRIELAIYDDHGGVQPPTKYEIEVWDGKAWQAVTGVSRSPEKPVGGQFNEARFDRVKARKVRVVFTHAGKARTGVSEIFVWNGGDPG